MLNRRGFIGAMAGMPLAAVVQPRPTVPVVGILTPSEVRAQEHLPPQVNLTIPNVRPLTALDRDELARVIGDTLTSRFMRVGPR